MNPVIRKLIGTSVAMVSIPLLVFFACSNYLADAVLGPGSPYKTALCGGAAALAVNLILIFYVVMAFREDAQFQRDQVGQKTE